MASTKTIFSNYWFWVISLTPILLAMILVLLICNSCNDNIYSVWDSWLYWTKSPEQIIKLWSLLKVPLGVAFLCFPVAGLIAVNHRSQQTATQIGLAIEQHNFNTFFQHKEVYNGCLGEIEKKFSVHFSNRDSLYSLLFPGNNFTIINSLKAEDYSNSYIWELIKDTDKLMELANHLQQSENGWTKEALSNLYYQVKSADTPDGAKKYVTEQIIKLILKILENLSLLNEDTISGLKTDIKEIDKNEYLQYIYLIIKTKNKFAEFCGVKDIKYSIESGFFKYEFPSTAESMSERKPLKVELQQKLKLFN